ncbi:MAG: DNA repair protein RecO [Phycisphaerales bacterium]
MPATIDEGLCIRQWDFSETSQTVSVLCRRAGLVRGLAKGSRRATHPYSGGIELLTRALIGIIPRPSAELALITEWDLQETFPALRRSLAAHHAGLYVADLIQHAVHDHDPHPRLYDEAILALRSLEHPAARDSILTRFQWALLAETGYKPELLHDAASGRPLPPAAWHFFDPRLGALTSPPASADPEPPSHAHHPSLWRVRRETISALLAISQTVERGPAPNDPAPPSDPSTARAARFLAAYARHVFGREPRTMSLLFGSRLPR